MGTVACGTGGSINADNHNLANGQALGKCYAWVNFNGTGTVAIRKSLNVTSITDNGTGDYTVNFTVALPDANYCVNMSSQYINGLGTVDILSGGAPSPSPTTTAYRINCKATNAGTANDAPSLFASFFD